MAIAGAWPEGGSREQGVPPPPQTQTLNSDQWVRTEAARQQNGDHLAVVTEQPHLVQVGLCFSSLGSSGAQNYPVEASMCSTGHPLSATAFSTYLLTWSLAPLVGEWLYWIPTASRL